MTLSDLSPHTVSEFCPLPHLRYTTLFFNMHTNETSTSAGYQEGVSSLNGAVHVIMDDSSELPPPYKEQPDHEEHVRLTWRSWGVVLLTCFAQLAQVFVVVGTGQNLTFIAASLGSGSITWVIRKHRLLLIRTGGSAADKEQRALF